jgi:hypothetical protein
VRDAAAHILENTSLADLISGATPRSTKGRRTAKKYLGKKIEKGTVLPMVVGGHKGE